MFRFGEDAGEKSSALVAVDKNSKQICGSVAIFSSGVDPKEGNSLNSKRRQYRLSRRRKNSYQKRQKNLLTLCKEIFPFFDKSHFFKNSSFLLKKRALSADVVLENVYDLVRILYNISNCRGPNFNIEYGQLDVEDGYSDSAKDAELQKKAIFGILDIPGKTVGQKLLYYFENKKSFRNRQGNYLFVPHRNMIEEELNIILNTQTKNKKWGKYLTKENIQKIIKLIISQKPSTWDRDVLAHDSREPSQHRAFKNCSISQEFLVLNEINSTRINGKELTTEQKQTLNRSLNNTFVEVSLKMFKKHLELKPKDVVEGKLVYSNLTNIKINGIPLIESQINKACSLFCVKLANINIGRIRKILSLEDDDVISKVGDKKFFVCNKFKSNVEYIVYSNEYITNDRIIIDLDKDLKKIARSEGSSKLISKFKKYYGKRLSVETIDQLLNLPFYKDKINYSEVTLRNVLPYMREGFCEYDAFYKYAVISKDNRYLNEISLNKKQRQTIKNGNKIGIFKMPSLPFINNPRARRTMGILREQLQNLVEHCGKPEAIHVECARELKKSSYVLEKEKSENKFLTELNEQIKNLVENNFNLNISKKILDRVKLWIQQDGKCLYSLKDISLKDAIFGNDLEVDHIVPQSYGKVNISNKVLVYKKCNQDKGALLPFQYLSQHEFKEMINYCEKLEKIENYKNVTTVFKKPILMNEGKINKLKTTEIPKEFLDGQITNLAYTEKQIINWLKPTFFPEENHRVAFIIPQLVSQLRKRWNFEKKDRSNHKEHLLDAILIACLDASTALELISILKEEKRTKEYKNLAPKLPWDSFVEDTKKFIEQVVVYHVPNRKQNFSLHEDNPLRIPKPDKFRSDVNGFVSTRKKITSLSLSHFHLPDSFEGDYLELMNSKLTKKQRKELIQKIAITNDERNKKGSFSIVKNRELCFQLRKLFEDMQPSLKECFKQAGKQNSEDCEKEFKHFIKSLDKTKIILNGKEIKTIEVMTKLKEDCLVRVSSTMVYKSGNNNFVLIFKDKDCNLNYKVVNNLESGKAIQSIKKTKKLSDNRISFHEIYNYFLNDDEKLVLALRRGDMLKSKVTGKIYVIKKMDQEKAHVQEHFKCESADNCKMETVTWKRLPNVYKIFHPKKVYTTFAE